MGPQAFCRTDDPRGQFDKLGYGYDRPLHRSEKPLTSCKFGFQANSVGGCRYGVVYLKREIAVFLFPIAISCIVTTIFVFQILIFCIARAQVKKIWKQTCPLQRRHQTSYLKHMKATTTIILLLTAFLVSWLPSTIFRFHDRITGGDLQTFHKWLHVLNTFIQIHCCLDPYLYVFRNQRFKSVITRYLKRRSDRQVVFTSQASMHNVSIQLVKIGQGRVVE